MSIYRPKASPFYHYDFRLSGKRFHGSTGSANRREAEQVVRSKKDEVRRALLLSRPESAKVSLQLDHVAERYWQEVGKDHANADNTDRDLARLVQYFGPAKLLCDITDADVSALVGWRSAQRAMPHNAPKDKKPEDYPLVSAATINRTTVEVLKKLFTHAKNVWGVRFENEPKWKIHMRAEPVERVRELALGESARLMAATRSDYEPFFEFVRKTALRKKECIDLRWREVNWDAGQIVRLGKGGKRVVTPLTKHLRQLLEPLRGHHPEFVFTYVAARTVRSRKVGTQVARTGNRKTKGEEYTAQRDQEERIQGQRYPLTMAGVNSAWKRLRKKAGVGDFRFHDFRHDLATKLLRKTGNLKLVSRVLNHADLKTTMRYAHVLDEDVAVAMEAFHGPAKADQQDRDSLQNLDVGSRNNSRNKLRAVK